MFQIGYNNSLLVMKLIDELIDLVSNELEYSDEYYQLLDKIYAAIMIENMSYDSLDCETANQYIDELLKKYPNFDEDGILERYYNKLNEKFLREQIPEAVINGYYKDTLIEANILIRTLKRTIDCINSCGYDDSSEEEFYYDLYKYFHESKYDIIFSNPYLEKLSMQIGFKVHRYKNINFSDEQLKEMSYGFKVNAKQIIDLLLEKENNCYDVCETFAVLFEISKLDVYLDLMNLDDVKSVYNYFNKKKGNLKQNIILENIHKILVRKKEKN